MMYNLKSFSTPCLSKRRSRANQPCHHCRWQVGNIALVRELADKKQELEEEITQFISDTTSRVERSGVKDSFGPMMNFLLAAGIKKRQTKSKAFQEKARLKIEQLWIRDCRKEHPEPRNFANQIARPECIIAFGDIHTGNSRQRIVFEDGLDLPSSVYKNAVSTNQTEQVVHRRHIVPSTEVFGRDSSTPTPVYIAIVLVVALKGHTKITMVSFAAALLRKILPGNKSSSNTTSTSTCTTASSNEDINTSWSLLDYSSQDSGSSSSLVDCEGSSCSHYESSSLLNYDYSSLHPKSIIKAVTANLISSTTEFSVNNTLDAVKTVGIPNLPHLPNLPPLPDLPSLTIGDFVAYTSEKATRIHNTSVHYREKYGNLRPPRFLTQKNDRVVSNQPTQTEVSQMANEEDLLIARLLELSRAADEARSLFEMIRKREDMIFGPISGPGGEEQQQQQDEDDYGVGSFITEKDDINFLWGDLLAINITLQKTSNGGSDSTCASSHVPITGPCQLKHPGQVPLLWRKEATQNIFRQGLEAYHSYKAFETKKKEAQANAQLQAGQAHNGEGEEEEEEEEDGKQKQEAEAEGEEALNALRKLAGQAEKYFGEADKGAREELQVQHLWCAPKTQHHLRSHTNKGSNGNGEERGRECYCFCKDCDLGCHREEEDIGDYEVLGADQDEKEVENGGADFGCGNEARHGHCDWVDFEGDDDPAVFRTSL
ncbi:hypothetical protein MKZ38_005021 [Zalerion maritima]|uniref:Uncharacterized protein n=1 Tax=Zalerion maritima TaxID=339359 RepID=A0AAD5RKU9_9PEZI|nr:hypothetical protein MKZ38_005021 [Zalerion maritima]